MSVPQGTVRWSFESYGTSAVAPSFARGRVYVGGASLCTLDLASGRLLWRCETEDIADCTPVVVDRTVFATGGDLLAVDAETGTVRWRRRPAAPEGGFHGAAHADGMICAGTGPATVYACDAATGEDLWHVALDGFPAAEPRFADGLCYVSRTEGLHAVDATTGTREWTAETAGAVITAPAISQGRAFIGMGMPSSGGTLGVRAVDAGSGRTLWHVDTDGYVGSAPVVEAGVLYATSAGGTVFTLDPATGRAGWCTQVHDAGDGLAVADGVVSVCGTRAVTALDARAGSPLWSSEPEVFGLCAPLVVNGTVVLCDGQGVVHAVAPPPF